MSKPFTIYKDDDQWIPFFRWFWDSPAFPTSNNMGHGAYPAKWIAYLSARWHCR